MHAWNCRWWAILVVLAAALAAGCDAADRNQAREQAKDQAHDLAARTREAASDVKDHVESGVRDLKTDARQAGDELKDSKLGEAMRETVKDSAGSARQALDDTAVTARVKAALLADRNVMSSHISVETFQGHVKLSGQLPDRAQVQRAEEIARRTEGVKAVENHLTASG